MSAPPQIFDRRAVRLHRARAARQGVGHDFLIRECAERLAERLGEVRRDFRRVLDLGGRCGDALPRGFELMVRTALSRPERPSVLADEERLPFAEGAFDLVVSNLVLHAVNDLPGALIQINRALVADGLLLGALFGGETLIELRRALLDAEAEVEGGVSPRVSPMAEVRDLGGLLQRAGFALPMVDRDRVTVTYEHPFDLMADLRGMGEANALAERRRSFSRRATLMRSAEIYAERHAGADGRVRATFEILFLTAWAPHADQPRPLRPGSAGSRLADALGTEELDAGERAEPGRTKQ